MKNKQYFQLVTAGNTANLNIYGEITSYPWLDSDVSAANLSAQLAEMQGVTNINVFINSYGGEVAEGLAIYNALKRHPAQVTTYCDGFACSIASVIFMAGDERVMGNPSRLMIHDAWTSVWGANADELRKQADDLDNITNASVKAYMQHINITEEELRAKMKAESWLTEEEALEMGFATRIDEPEETEKPSQSARKRVFDMLIRAMAQNAAETPQNDEDDEDEELIEPNTETSESAADDAAATSEENNEQVPDPAQRWSGFFNAISRAMN